MTKTMQRMPSAEVALSREVASDLRGHFQGEATYAELKNWLGPEDRALSAALIDLLRDGRVSVRWVGR